LKEANNTINSPTNKTPNRRVNTSMDLNDNPDGNNDYVFT